MKLCRYGPFGQEKPALLDAEGVAAIELRLLHPADDSPREFKTVRLLADLLIPADARSGSASDAGVTLVSALRGFTRGEAPTMAASPTSAWCCG